MASPVSDHVYHEYHGADAVKNRCHDAIPISLRVRLVWPVWWDVDFHRSKNGCKQARGNVPEDYGHRQSHYVANLLRKIHEQEEVPDKAADQRRRVQPIAPSWVFKWNAIQLRHPFPIYDHMHPPVRDQRRDREHVCQRPERSSKKRNRRACKPPIILAPILPPPLPKPA